MDLVLEKLAGNKDEDSPISKPFNRNINSKFSAISPDNNLSFTLTKPNNLINTSQKIDSITSSPNFKLPSINEQKSINTSFLSQNKFLMSLSKHPYFKSLIRKVSLEENQENLINNIKKELEQEEIRNQIKHRKKSDEKISSIVNHEALESSFSDKDSINSKPKTFIKNLFSNIEKRNSNTSSQKNIEQNLNKKSDYSDMMQKLDWSPAINQLKRSNIDYNGEFFLNNSLIGSDIEISDDNSIDKNEILEDTNLSKKKNLFFSTKTIAPNKIPILQVSECEINNDYAFKPFYNIKTEIESSKKIKDSCTIKKLSKKKYVYLIFYLG